MIIRRSVGSLVECQWLRRSVVAVVEWNRKLALCGDHGVVKVKVADVTVVVVDFGIPIDRIACKLKVDSVVDGLLLLSYRVDSAFVAWPWPPGHSMDLPQIPTGISPLSEGLAPLPLRPIPPGRNICHGPLIARPEGAQPTVESLAGASYFNESKMKACSDTVHSFPGKTSSVIPWFRCAFWLCRFFPASPRSRARWVHAKSSASVVGKGGRRGQPGSGANIPKIIQKAFLLGRGGKPCHCFVWLRAPSGFDCKRLWCRVV